MKTNPECIFTHQDACLSLNLSTPLDYAGELKRGHSRTIPGGLNINWDLYFLFYAEIFISLGALFLNKVYKCF